MDALQVLSSMANKIVQNEQKQDFSMWRSASMNDQ